MVLAPLPCIVGLDRDETEPIRRRYGGPLICHASLPKIVVRNERLFVESQSGARMLPVSKVIYHGIFEDDHDFIAGLALWGGQCLPDAVAMMDCRLKLPCLVRSLKLSAFVDPPRGYASPGTHYATDVVSVAKWGNWHCGENKRRFESSHTADQPTIIEPFIEGEAVRIVVMDDREWQIRLAGNGWLKSIHHDDAAFETPEPRLVEDTRNVGRGFGLRLLANDYIVDIEGRPHLLEVNHVPNVVRFGEIWDAYVEWVVEFLNR